MMKIRALAPNVLNITPKKRVLPYRIRNWLVETKAWIRNVIAGSHRVRPRVLKIGHWYDSDTKIFESAFQILVDYVEKELAWMQLLTDNKAKWYHRWFGIPAGRELGLKYLGWEMSLGDDSSDQSEAARDIWELYLWYTDVRPSRTDPYDQLPDRPFNWVEDEDGNQVVKSLHTDAEFVLAVNQAQLAEAAYEQEDTSMLIRLMHVRHFMWT